MQALHTWLVSQTALPKSLLHEALSYTLHLWPGLSLFVDDPRVPLDNNLVERDLRGVVVGRKNHYGSKSGTRHPGRRPALHPRRDRPEERPRPPRLPTARYYACLAESRRSSAALGAPGGLCARLGRGRSEDLLETAQKNGHDPPATSCCATTHALLNPGAALLPWEPLGRTLRSARQGAERGFTDQHRSPLHDQEVQRSPRPARRQYQ